MTNTAIFTGFPAEGLQFLRDLQANNNREWFQVNKAAYETQLQAPAQDFVVALGTRLQELEPTIQIDTRTNGQGSLMRIYRDTRFSKDKTPYKTAVAGMFWDGQGKKTTRPAFGFHLEADHMELMAGMFHFDKEQLAAYREAVAHDQTGGELSAALDAVQSTGNYTAVGQHYKRVPRGYDADHPRADLLRYAGLYVHPTAAIGEEYLTRPELVDIAFDHCRNMAPIERWLAKHVAGPGS